MEDRFSGQRSVTVAREAFVALSRRSATRRCRASSYDSKASRYDSKASRAIGRWRASEYASGSRGRAASLESSNRYSVGGSAGGSRTEISLACRATLRRRSPLASKAGSSCFSTGSAFRRSRIATSSGRRLPAPPRLRAGGRAPSLAPRGSRMPKSQPNRLRRSFPLVLCARWFAREVPSPQRSEQPRGVLGPADRTKVRRGPSHDASEIVSDGAEGGSRSGKNPAKAFELRLGRILELVEKYKGTGGSRRTNGSRIVLQQKNTRTINHRNRTKRSSFVSESMLPPPINDSVIG
jgi:hypothetical protein